VTTNTASSQSLAFVSNKRGISTTANFCFDLLHASMNANRCSLIAGWTIFSISENKELFFWSLLLNRFLSTPALDTHSGNISNIFSIVFSS